MNFEKIWKNIQFCEGETFTTIRGVEYKYVLYNDYLLINNDPKRRIPKQSLQNALEITNPTCAKIGKEGIWGPSYVYGIITDKRIKA